MAQKPSVRFVAAKTSFLPHRKGFPLHVLSSTVGCRYATAGVLIGWGCFGTVKIGLRLFGAVTEGCLERQGGLPFRHSPW